MQARLDLFGVVVLAFVVALSGGFIRDLLIGVPPQTFRDWRYLAAAIAAGVVCAVLPSMVHRAQSSMLIFNALGLSLFCVTGAAAALAAGVGPLQATIVGAITGVGGGIVRDVLLTEVPTVLRQELYASATATPPAVPRRESCSPSAPPERTLPEQDQVPPLANLTPPQQPATTPAADSGRPARSPEPGRHQRPSVDNDTPPAPFLYGATQRRADRRSGVIPERWPSRAFCAQKVTTVPTAGCTKASGSARAS